MGQSVMQIHDQIMLDAWGGGAGSTCPPNIYKRCGIPIDPSPGRGVVFHFLPRLHEPLLTYTVECAPPSAEDDTVPDSLKWAPLYMKDNQCDPNAEGDPVTITIQETDVGTIKSLEVPIPECCKFVRVSTYLPPETTIRIEIWAQIHHLRTKEV